MKIDDLDRKILNVMLDNSRQSLREIAKKTGVSVVTVLKRVNALEKEGVIKAYTTELNYEKLGYDVSVVIHLRIAKGKLFEVEKKIAIDPHVFAVYDVTGDFDALVIAKFKNRRAMDMFLKKVQSYPFVERTETDLILNEIKEKNIRVY
ncbi:Lrp/AsnC family transcriptional regulator [Candidatus Woesearchaeota archaeon]|nr:Lrp/AsnC family transcriptional regulator [Candidatus Woesearchaeota archaeon]